MLTMTLVSEHTPTLHLKWKSQNKYPLFKKLKTWPNIFKSIGSRPRIRHKILKKWLNGKFWKQHKVASVYLNLLWLHEGNYEQFFKLHVPSVRTHWNWRGKKKHSLLQEIISNPKRFFECHFPDCLLCPEKAGFKCFAFTKITPVIS